MNRLERWLEHYGHWIIWLAIFAAIFFDIHA